VLGHMDRVTYASESAVETAPVLGVGAFLRVHIQTHGASRTRCEILASGDGDVSRMLWVFNSPDQTTLTFGSEPERGHSFGLAAKTNALKCPDLSDESLGETQPHRDDLYRG
jgi:hypothetical protein